MLVAYAIMFCLAFTAAVLLAPAVRFVAVRIGAVDRPDGRRKIHTRPTPRLGGLVIGVAIFLAVILYYFLSPGVASSVMATPAQVVGFSLGFGIILGLGIVDDIRGVRPRIKLAFQTLAVVACYSTGLRVDVPFVTNPILASVLSFPVTWFWLVACINSMNLVDGMDGLASGVAFFAGAVIFILAAVYSKFAVALAATAVLGSVVGFLMYNFHPAVMFLGDSGSLLLGYLIAILAMAGSLKSHATLALLIPILALGLPIMDTLLAILRRVSRRLPVSQADREHIHHRLLDMGFSHRDAVLVLYSACLMLGLGALVLATAGSLLVGVVLGLVCLAAIAAVRFIGAHELAHFFRRLGEGLRVSAHERRAAAEKNTVFWLSQAASSEDISRAMAPWLEAIGASSAVVRVDGVAEPLVSAGECSVSISLATSEVPVVLSTGRTVRLVVSGSVGDLHLSEKVIDALAGALERTEKQGIRDALVISPSGRLSEGFAVR